MSGDAEIEKLARRISWLDRYRRPLSIGVATFIVLPLMWWWLSGWLPPNWPGAHTAFLAITIAAAAWYGIETLLGLALAIWETDHANLTRPAALPRAEVIERRK